MRRSQVDEDEEEEPEKKSKYKLSVHKPPIARKGGPDVRMM
jgi:hypothetical protein